MAFHEVRLDDDLAYGSSGGPSFSTDVVIMSSGHERRNIRWIDARRSWDLAYSIINQERLDSLLAFFVARQGRGHGFRFKDISDFTATVQPTALVTGLQYQLQKAYTSGSTTILRDIQKPVSGQVTVYVDAVEVGATVNLTTGIVTLNSSPGAGVVTWSGQFDIPVRFDTDQISCRLEAFNSGDDRGAYDVGSVPIIEIRV